MKLAHCYKYWLKNNSLSLQSVLADKLSSGLFILGKLLRLAFLLGVLLAIKDKINLVAGYNVDQLIVFFLIFNLFDSLGQLLYRGIYWFREDILSGNFDFKLLKPLNPLFLVLTEKTDFLDLPVLVLVAGLLINRLPHVSYQEIIIYCCLSFISMLLITAIHIFVAAVGILTTEVDHAIWIYRNLSQMAQVPVDIYAPPLQAVLTFVIPIGLIFTFPGKALYGLLSPVSVIIMISLGIIFYYLALKFWYYALRQYASASS